MTRLLLCAALAAETQAFPPDGDWGIDGVDVRSVVTGPGKVNAAAHLAGFLLDHPQWRPDLVLNVGTAGALADRAQGICEVAVVEQHDLDVPTLRRLTDEAFWHGPRRLVLLGRVGHAARARRPAPRAHVLLSGDHVVADRHERTRLGAVADLVDMEAYGVAALCARAGVAAAATKYVSDRADESAIVTWKSEVARASSSLREWITEHAGVIRARDWAEATD